MAGDSDGRGGVGRGSTGSPGRDSSPSGGSSSGNGKGAAGNGGSRKGNKGFGDPSTHTNFGGSSVSVGHAEVGAVQGDRSAGGRNGATGGVYGNAETGGVAGYGGRFGRELDTRATDIAGSNQSITSGTIASMDEAAEQAERSFLDRTDFRSYADVQRGYQASPGMQTAERAVETIADQTGVSPSKVGDMIGAENYGSMVEGNLDAAYGGVQQASRPRGLLSTVQNVATGLLGPVGMAVDLTADSIMGGRKAAGTFAALNDQFGTSFDADVSNNIGRHAAANTLGTVASMGMSRFGADVGMQVAGLEGAIGGGLIAGQMGRQVGNQALASQGGTLGTGDPSQGAQPRGLLASATNQAPATTTAPTINGPADFDGYASYAESFFA